MGFKAIDLTATSTPSSHTFAFDGTVIIGLQVGNASTTASVVVDVMLRGKYILRNGEIPFGGSLSVLDGKIVANDGDVLQVVTGGEPVDVIISYME